MSSDQLKKAWLSGWRRAAARLDQVRDENIQAANTTESILIFEGPFRAALLNQPPSTSSGLVEWQRRLRLRFG